MCVCGVCTLHSRRGVYHKRGPACCVEECLTGMGKLPDLSVTRVGPTTQTTHHTPHPHTHTHTHTHTTTSVVSAPTRPHTHTHTHTLTHTHTGVSQRIFKTLRNDPKAAASGFSY